MSNATTTTLTADALPEYIGCDRDSQGAERIMGCPGVHFQKIIGWMPVLRSGHRIVQRFSGIRQGSRESATAYAARELQFARR